MLKLLSNHTSAVLWGGRGIGRSITLALARNGSEVAFADPSKSEMEKVRDLLISKKADVLGAAWNESPQAGEGEYGRAAEEALERMHAAYPFFHRLVLAMGIDERFWSAPGGSGAAEANLILGRLEAVVRQGAAALANQERPGRLIVLWPREQSLMFDEAKASIAHLGGVRLRDLAEEGAGRGVEVSLVWTGPSEGELWKPGGPELGELLRPGEIADTIVAMATFPRRVLLEEATLKAFGPVEIKSA